ncbi:P-loop containing nucleoside triphosphate hydrolase protein [Paraphysoderma sedebokerense]|nr:P-loop containing nucleoside triphosphate hydrolase protein [Paraphysoderma sedebokerense]
MPPIALHISRRSLFRFTLYRRWFSSNSESSDFGSLLPPLLSSGLKQKFSITAPTPIQSQILTQFAESSKDLIIRDVPGTGKTFGLLLCLLSSFNSTHQQGLPSIIRHSYIISPKHLFIVPSMELANQIYGWATQLVPEVADNSIDSIIQCHNSIRNDSSSQSIKSPFSAPHILISTPGLLCNSITSNEISIERLSTIVIDELDRIIPPWPQFDKKKQKVRKSRPKKGELVLDYIYKHHIRQFDHHDPKSNSARSTSPTPRPRLIAASATFNSNLKIYLRSSGWIRRPEFLDLSGGIKISPNLKFQVLSVPGSDDLQANPDTARSILISKLLEHCRNNHINRTLLVPTLDIISVSELHRQLSDIGVQSQILSGSTKPSHSNLSTKSQQSPNMAIISPTSLQGIDSQFEHVFVLGKPKSPSELSQFAGRVGRMGKPGNVVCIVKEGDVESMHKLIDFVK